MEFDLENPLGNFHDLPCDAVPSLFLIESDHIPPPNYCQSLKATDFDISVRRDVVSFISQQPKPWANKLLAISCFSLAAKMLKTEYSATDVQALLNHGDTVIFETQTIQRMEALVLGTLQWRMRSITPFSFIPFFINLFGLKDPTLKKVLKDRTSEIILKSQREIKVLDFKPSIVAASSLLYASHELFPFQYPCFLRAISNCSYVNKESVMQGYNVIQDIVREEYESVFNVNSSSDTPVNVLDEHFLSMESEKTNGINVASTMIQKQDLKRRKVTDYGNNCTVQFSHFHQC
ncbi:putative cyclin-D6-1 isoform X2 [Abrus precatorius]|uniref:B-like cyclin n=1 Tax=Abrus precatorius TaxID=3816 RepID=A0A8B8KIJ8_ABRPR|nr:putative cyclin-D6-1 isoform X2 [Abrus precatorius]